MPEMNKTEKPVSPGVGPLRGDLQIFPGARDCLGGETWVVFDPVADRYCKIDDESRSIMKRLDKVQTLEELRARLDAQGVSLKPGVLESSVRQLAAGGLLCGASDKPLAEMAAKSKRAILVNRLLQSYLFLNIPLLKPDAFFTRTAGLAGALFNKWSVGLLALLSLCGYLSLLPAAERLGSVFWSSLSPRGLVGYLLAVCVLKFVHELSHAYVAKLRGVRVREMGLAMIVFFPRFYTNVTDAWRLPSRKARCAIDGAGIAAELVVGGFAALLWRATPPGALNSVAYFLFAASAINTLIVNGNPFIKYDGYYLLMDLTNIDNLQARANALLRNRVRAICFGIGPLELSDEWRDVRGWRFGFLLAFAVLSFLYRLFLYGSIILIVYLKFTKALGIVLLLLELHVLVLKPLWGELRAILAMRGSFEKVNAAATAIVVAALALVALMPLPWELSMPCEILPDQTQGVFAQVPGELKTLPPQDGASVGAGAPLLRLENPLLSWSEKESLLRLDSLKMELDQIQEDKTRRPEIPAQLKKIEAEEGKLADIRRKKELLSVNSMFPGVFQLYDRQLKAGKWLNEGEAVGELFSSDGRRVRAFAMETDIGRLAPGDRVKVFLEGSLETLPGVIESVDLAPSKSIASSSLLDAYGGPLQTVREPLHGEILLLHPLYRVNIRLDGSDAGAAPGRSGSASLRKYSSAGLLTFRWISSSLRRELSF